MGIYKSNNEGAIGIGALIIFIAMVLVAGIAASVIIQTSNTLESRSSAVGRETTREVGSGITIFSIEAYAATGSDISRLAILVRPRAGSKAVDLTHTYIEISDKNVKSVLNYTSANYSEPDGLDDIFSADVYPDDNYGYHHTMNTDGSRYGLLVLDDPDSSMSRDAPLLTRGDKVYLCINTTGVFNDVAENTELWGQVIPEIGYSARIDIRTPYTYADNVMELFWDM